MLLTLPSCAHLWLPGNYFGQWSANVFPPVPALETCGFQNQLPPDILQLPGKFFQENQGQEEILPVTWGGPMGGTK